MLTGLEDAAVRPPPATVGSGRLLVVLGVAFGIAVTVGNTIGVGILRTPGEVAALLPRPGLFMAVWIAGGVYALLGSNALAELAAMTPESGGYTVFVRRALGPFPGFVVGWSDWLSTCGSTAAVAIVIGEYAGVLVPALAGRGMALASAAVLAFGIVQWRGVRSADATQQATTLLKALAFLALIAACFALRGPRPPAPAPAILPDGLGIFAPLVLAMQAVIFTYDGFSGVTYFAGEVTRPASDIPRSVFGGVLAVIVIYLLVNAAFLYVLPIEAMAGQELVAATAANALFGPRGDLVIRALVILSLISSVNALVLIGSRIFYGVSASGLLPAGTRVNTGGTPATALAATLAASLIFILSGTFEQVIAITAFFFVANYVLSFASVFALRWREPAAPRPFRAFGHPWTTLVVLVGSLAFLSSAVLTDTRNSILSLALLALTWPLFILLRRRMRT